MILTITWLNINLTCKRSNVYAFATNFLLILSKLRPVTRNHAGLRRNGSDEMAVNLLSHSKKYINYFNYFINSRPLSPRVHYKKLYFYFLKMQFLNNSKQLWDYVFVFYCERRPSLPKIKLGHEVNAKTNLQNDFS